MARRHGYGRGATGGRKFPALPGCVYPLYHVLADIGEMKGGKWVPDESWNHLQVEGLTIEANGHRRTFVANMTDAPTAVTIRGAKRKGRVRLPR